MQSSFANLIPSTTDRADTVLQGSETLHSETLQVLTAAEMAQVAGGLETNTKLPVSTW